MAGVKGKSGRKPNERIFRVALLDRLEQLDETNDRKRIFNIAEKLVRAAEDGDIQAIREVMDRVDGKATQPTENKHDISDPLMDLLNSVASVGRRISDAD